MDWKVLKGGGTLIHPHSHPKYALIKLCPWHSGSGTAGLPSKLLFADHSGPKEVYIFTGVKRSETTDPSVLRSTGGLNSQRSPWQRVGAEPWTQRYCIYMWAGMYARSVLLCAGVCKYTLVYVCQCVVCVLASIYAEVVPCTFTQPDESRIFFVFWCLQRLREAKPLTSQYPALPAFSLSRTSEGIFLKLPTTTC